nr:MAG TPA: hypothetical protein [Caudoviricetes sp.]
MLFTSPINFLLVYPSCLAVFLISYTIKTTNAPFKRVLIELFNIF